VIVFGLTTDVVNVENNPKICSTIIWEMRAICLSIIIISTNSLSLSSSSSSFISGIISGSGNVYNNILLFPPENHRGGFLNDHYNHQYIPYGNDYDVYGVEYGPISTSPKSRKQKASDRRTRRAQARAPCS
jgi:hypothetical protein